MVCNVKKLRTMDNDNVQKDNVLKIREEAVGASIFDFKCFIFQITEVQ